MKVLLDTNVIIEREASTITNPEIGLLFSWLDKLHYEKCIHNLTVKEIERHKDKKVRETFNIKLQSYNLLKVEAPFNQFVNEVSKKMDSSDNDLNDTKLINEIVNNRVDFLITGDKKIHEKARLLNVGGKIFTIESFLEKLISENPGLINYATLSVKPELFGKINVNDSFFDQFRLDYKGFNDWFNEKSEEPCYICKDADKILAFLYLKTENETEDYRDISPTFSKAKRLKIGTFKVILNGYKLGERFLKIIFDNALKQKVEEIYVTIFNNSPGKERLINLLIDWGFKYWGVKKTKSGEEEVYLRDFRKRFDVSNPKLSFPYLSSNVDVFFFPIFPDYHTDLLPDSILTTESLENFVENKPSRNAISKTYISRAFTCSNLKKGDILLFYRTKEQGKSAYYSSVITTLGIVDSIITKFKDESEFIALCKKRSVFSNEELSKQWNYSPNKPFLVNFLYTYSFPKRINLQELIELKVIRDIMSVPRFKKISKENFEKILKATNSDPNIIVTT